MIRYLLDENTPGPLMKAIGRYCARESVAMIDVIRVGDADGPDYGTSDPDLLVWCQQANRILVSDDVRTMPGFLMAHLTEAGHSPGLFLRKPGISLNETAEWLVTIVGAGRPEEYANMVTWIPL